MNKYEREHEDYHVLTYTKSLPVI